MSTDEQMAEWQTDGRQRCQRCSTYSI